jgi:sirohydrochlorin ferrochelatase
MTAPAAPVLLAVAHGTRDPTGLAEIRRLVEKVRQARPDLEVRLCWLELAEPLLTDALAGCSGPVVVVPLLLSTGYHIKTDIAGAVAGRPRTAVAAQLGPDARIAAALLGRLRETGTPPAANPPDGAGGSPQADNPSRETGEPPPAGIALFGAGSSDPEAAENLAVAADQLKQLAGSPVHPRFLTDPNWRDDLPPDVTAASYLLAPGFFADRLAGYARTELGLNRAAAPLGAHPAVVEVVLDRYAEAARRLAP